MDESIIVIKYDDKPKFFDALKVPESAASLAGKVAGGTVGGILVGVGSFLVLGPIGPVLTAAGGATVGALTARRNSQSAKALTSVTPLGRLARVAADIVFVPLIGMAICDKPLQDDEKDFIRRKMNGWGYSDEFTDAYIVENSNRQLDTLKLIINDNTKKVKALAASKKLYRGEVNIKYLQQESYKMCKQMYDETHNGLTDSVNDAFLKELRFRFEIKEKSK